LTSSLGDAKQVRTRRVEVGEAKSISCSWRCSDVTDYQGKEVGTSKRGTARYAPEFWHRCGKGTFKDTPYHSHTGFGIGTGWCVSCEPKKTFEYYVYE